MNYFNQRILVFLNLTKGNFINILRADFTRAEPKSAKNTDGFIELLHFWDLSARKNLTLNMLTKSTPSVLELKFIVSERFRPPNIFKLDYFLAQGCQVQLKVSADIMPSLGQGHTLQKYNKNSALASSRAEMFNLFK